MRSSLAVMSKASRLPLTPKQGNKDFYKGTRAAALPGGPRTGAPGKHIVRGTGKYRIIDEKVRYFVAPSIQDMENSPLKPYVHVSTKMSAHDKLDVFGRMPRGGFSGAHYLKIAREQAEWMEDEPLKVLEEIPPTPST